MSSSASYFLPAPTLSYSAGSSARARRWLDAKTLDYVVAAGGLKQDEGWTSKVVLALSTRLGSCQVFPAFGSRLYQIKRADETGRRLAEAYARLALVYYTIDSLLIIGTLPKPGQIYLVVAGKKSGQPVHANYTVSL